MQKNDHSVTLLEPVKSSFAFSEKHHKSERFFSYFSSFVVVVSPF
jgi:hypothetical protein